jgi:hypothetical protein
MNAVSMCFSTGSVSRQGPDLVERVADELVDKAMVVVVETPKAVLSDWVRLEVSIAAAQHLGLAAIHVTGDATLPLIEDRARRGWTTDQEVGHSLVEQHRMQIRQKREDLLNSVWQALLAAPVPAWDISARAHGFTLESAGVRYELPVHPRPANLHRFRLAHERAGSAVAVIVHPFPVRVVRRQDLAWLTSTTDVAQVDEGQLTEAVAVIVRGGQS